VKALTVGLLEREAFLMSRKKDVLQFAAFVAEEAEEGLGLEALATAIPVDQMEVTLCSLETLLFSSTT